MSSEQNQPKWVFLLLISNSVRHTFEESIDPSPTIDSLLGTGTHIIINRMTFVGRPFPHPPQGLIYLREISCIYNIFT